MDSFVRIASGSEKSEKQCKNVPKMENLQLPKPIIHNKILSNSNRFPSKPTSPPKDEQNIDRFRRLNLDPSLSASNMSPLASEVLSHLYHVPQTKKTVKITSLGRKLQLWFNSCTTAPIVRFCSTNSQQNRTIGAVVPNTSGELSIHETSAPS